MNNLHAKPSTWAAVASLILTGFMSQPTLASLIVHLANIGVLALVIYLAHWEGRSAAGEQALRRQNQHVA